MTAIVAACISGAFAFAAAIISALVLRSNHHVSRKVDPISNGFAGNTKDSLTALLQGQADNASKLANLTGRFDEWTSSHAALHAAINPVIVVPTKEKS